MASNTKSKGKGNEQTKEKREMPITKDQFLDAAKPVTVVIDGKAQSAEVKEFSTGSLGWYFNGKVSIEVDGELVPCQVGMNITVIGSKPAK